MCTFFKLDSRIYWRILGCMLNGLEDFERVGRILQEYAVQR